MSTRSRHRRLVGQTTIAVLLVVVGATFIFAPERATSGSYAVAFDVANALPGDFQAPVKWGIAFVLAGLCALIVPRVTSGPIGVCAAALPIFWMLWWALLLGLAIIVDEAQSLNGPAAWLAFTIIYAWSLTEYGVPRKVWPKT